MASPKHRFTVVLSALALACSGVDPDAGEATSSETESALRFGPQVPRLVWKPCGEAFPGAECAIAEVPLDYARPRTKTALALAKIPASDPALKLGTLFVNPGGPGASGAGFVLSGFGQVLSASLGGRFDVVGFDPRGVGTADPVACFDSTAELEAYLSALPAAFPYRREYERPFFKRVNEYVEHCFDRGQGPLLAHMSTADVARDLDLLRQAVGDAKLSYIGWSYGSLIGSTYANLFPNKVRALVIDGVLNPELWASGREITADRVASDEVFYEFMRLCDEAGDSCALSGPEGAEERFQALADFIFDTPLDLGGGFLYSYDLFLSDMLAALYWTDLWADQAALLAALSDLAFGDTAARPRVLALRQSLLERMELPKLGNEVYDNSFEAFFGYFCGDAEYPETFAEFRKVARFAARDSRFGALWWWGNATPCVNWPASPSRYEGPWVTRTSAPVLVVGNYFDPATNYAGAVAVSKFLKNSRLLTYAGWGHTASFGPSTCVTDYVVSYLLDGALPPRGTVCPANPNPFTETVPVASAAGVGAESAGTSLGRPALAPWIRPRFARRAP